MLSHYEVVAKDRSQLFMLLYSTSKSAQNLARTGKASLLFLDEEMSYYVRVSCSQMPHKIEGAPDETLFNAKVSEVLEDKFPTSEVTSGITFTGFDPGMTEEGRRNVFQSLAELSTS